MRDLSQIGTCFEVTDDDIGDALAPARSLKETSPRERILALLGRMAAIARPRQGAPKILIAIAHMATRDWIEGDLLVTVAESDAGTDIALSVDEGASVSRFGQPLRVAAPFQEFEVAVRARADMLLPLRPDGEFRKASFTLRATALARRTSMPPPLSAVDPEILMPASTRLAPPRLWDAEAPTQPKPVPARAAKDNDIKDIDEGWE